MTNHWFSNGIGTSGVRSDYSTSNTKYVISKICHNRYKMYWAVVVVAQLVEQLLPTAELRGKNLVIGKKLY